MQSLEINAELQNLIPPLTEDEYQRLEKSISTEGCRDALVVWNNIIIDGHNRYEICKKHGINFAIIEKDMPDIEAVKEWIILNQFGRRNLSAYDRSLLALKLEGLFREKAKGNQRESGGAVPQKSAKPPIDTRQELAKIAGVSHDTITKVKMIDNKATPEQKGKLKTGEISINQAFTEIRKEERNLQKEKEREEYITVILPTETKYRVVYADPPWKYNDMQDTEKLGGAEKHYPTMSVNELCNLPISDMVLENAVLFLWTTSPLLEETFPVIKAWGFKYKTSFVWDKIRHNMGHYNSVRHELLLVCTNGLCTPDVKKLYDSVIAIEKTDKHSEKPEAFRNIIDTIYPHGKRIELFARRQPPEGWDIWGNEKI